MFIYFGCSTYITVSEFVERLHPLPLLISRAAPSSSTISNGLTFLINSCLFQVISTLTVNIKTVNMKTF